MRSGLSSGGRAARLSWAAAVVLTAAATGAACQQPRRLAPPEVPVRVGGETEADACAGVGQVVGLRKGGFLAVRAGPGTRYRTLDRLRTGQAVWLCEDKGEWRGVVYAAGAPDDCGVAAPQATRAAYRGACRSGWVYGRYVELTAG